VLTFGGQSFFVVVQNTRDDEDRAAVTAAAYLVTESDHLKRIANRAGLGIEFSGATVEDTMRQANRYLRDRFGGPSPVPLLAPFDHYAIDGDPLSETAVVTSEPGPVVEFTLCSACCQRLTSTDSTVVGWIASRRTRVVRAHWHRECWEEQHLAGAPVRTMSHAR
jgi:hypothetical protein